MFSITRTADSSHSDFDAAMAFVQLPATETYEQAKAAIAGYFLKWNDTPYAAKDEYINIAQPGPRQDPLEHSQDLNRT